MANITGLLEIMEMNIRLDLQQVYKIKNYNFVYRYAINY